MKKVSLKVKERDSFGGPESRRLRREGWVPGVLYGGGNESRPFSIEAKTLRKAFGHERGNVLIELEFDGADGSHSAILKEYQSDPVGGGLLHVDLLEIRMDQPIESNVYIELVGTAQGVRDGGIIDHGLRELHIRCLPKDIPSQIEVGVEALGIGDSLRVSDIVAPPGAEILDDPDTHVVGVMAPKLVVEEVPAEEVEEGAEAAAEGEAAPAAGEKPPVGEAGEGGEGEG